MLAWFPSKLLTELHVLVEYFSSAKSNFWPVLVRGLIFHGVMPVLLVQESDPVFPVQSIDYPT